MNFKNFITAMIFVGTAGLVASVWVGDEYTVLKAVISAIIIMCGMAFAQWIRKE